MNIKKICSALAITALVSFSISAVAFKQMGLNFVDFHNGGFNINISSQELMENGIDIYSKENVSINSIDDIRISVSSSDVFVAYEERSDVELVFEGKYLASGSYVPPKLVVENSSGMIDANIEHTNFSNMSVSSYHNLLVKLPLSYKGKLYLESVSGNINYQGGESSEVVVNTSSGDFVHGDVKSTDFKNETVDYSNNDIIADRLEVNTVSGNIQVGASSSKVLKMSASSGDIYVTGKTEKAEIEAVSGNIRGSINAKESTLLNTSSGDMDIESLTGRLTAKTTSGHLQFKMEDEISEINAESSSGDIDISKVICKSNVKTISGTVSIDKMIVIDDVYVETSSGDVRIGGLDGGNFALDAKTSSGDINSGLAVSVTGKIDEDSLKGNVGSGGHTLFIETISGGIDLE